MSAASPEQPAAPEPAVPPAAGKAPGPVLAAAILLYVGGASALLYGLLGTSAAGGIAGLLPPAPLALYGVLYLVLAWGVQHGLRWARTTLLVISAAALAFGPSA